MPIQMGTNLKRVKVFIDKYGQVQKGSIYENLGGNALGGITPTNRVAEPAKTNETEEIK